MQKGRPQGLPFFISARINSERRSGLRVGRLNTSDESKENARGSSTTGGNHCAGGAPAAGFQKFKTSDLSSKVSRRRSAVPVLQMGNPGRRFLSATRSI
jgi:hypothetical protein